jgi:hypothetical protein
VQENQVPWLISLLHEILFLFVSLFLSFPLRVKMIILCFVYSNNYKLTKACSSLSYEVLPSSCTIDLDPISSCETIEKNEVHISIPPEVDSSCKPENREDEIPSEIPVVSFHQPIEPVHPTEVQSRIRREIFGSLRLPPTLNAYPLEFFEYLPIFNGEDYVAAEKHMKAFEKFIDDFEVMHEDVVMRLFCKYLVRDVAFWFKNLEVGSIGSWDDFHCIFMRYWGKNKSDDQYISEFYALKRKENEVLFVFNWRFHNFVLSMPKDIRPSEAATMLQYIDCTIS